MTVPLEVACYRSLFTMSIVAGGIVNEARSHDRWDKQLMGYFASQLVDLIDDCELAEACREPAFELAGVLNELAGEPDTPDPQKVEEQVNNMGQGLANLVTCMFDVYALTDYFHANGNGEDRDWPDDDWMLTVRPLRVKAVR